MGEPYKLIEVEPDIYYIDALREGSHSVSGIYLILGDGITLIEAGTTHTAPYIIDAVNRLGFKKENIARCINTHIHLDHSCASGWLVEMIPDMKVYAHERGIRHLADPSKLLKSAEMVYGDIDTILEIHGEVLPVPHENLVPVTQAELDVGGGFRLRIFEGPGHAPHQICIFDTGSGCIFSGEALGHYLPEFDVITPAVAPPGFDLDASIETVEKIRALEPTVICFSQFGQRRDPQYVIEEWERQIHGYGDLVRSSLERGMGTGEIVESLVDQLKQDPHAKKFSEQSLRGMLMSTVIGYYQYFQRTGVIG